MNSNGVNGDSGSNGDSYRNSSAIQLIPAKASDLGGAIPSIPVLSNVDGDDINLRQIGFIFKHRLPLIFLVLLGTVALAAFWTFQKVPQYQGSFRLLVGDPIKGEDRLKTVNIDGLGPSEVDYATQIAVLQSAKILDPILKQAAPKYPDISLDSLTAGKKAPLHITQLDDTKILEIALRDEDPQKIEFLLNKLSQAYLRYSLDERKSEINQGIAFVDNQLPQLRQRFNTLQAQVQNFRQRNNLLDPEIKAQELSEQLIALDAKYLDTQVQLNEAQSLFQVLQQQVGVDTEGAIATSYLSESPRYQNLLNQLQEVELELAKQSAQFSDKNPIIETLQEKRKNILPLLAEESQKVLGRRFASYQDANASITSPNSLRLTLNQQFVQTANQIATLQVREKALSKEITHLRAQVKFMPILARQYNDLQQRLKVAGDSLNRFLEAQEKLQIDSAQQTFPWQLIAPTRVGKQPVEPNPLRNLTLATFAGLFLGTAAAFLAERLDPVFHSVDELKEGTQQPLLGIIPWQKDLNAIERILSISLPQIKIGNQSPSIKLTTPESTATPGSGYQTSGFLEAFRSLNTNIWLLGSEQQTKSFAISSTAPSEGKSTVSVHLAQAAAAMGQRVLLIDADLRRPRVHHALGIENSQGLSNVLATGLELEEALQRVPQWENLTVLTAGDIPPDPTRLLASVRMQKLREYLLESNTYDLVIFDTPPLLNFADARILGAMTAGLILVVRISKTDRAALQHVIDNLSMSQVPLLGLVANGGNPTGYGSSKYYYYYNYNYAKQK